jgi:DNA polymerase III delta prime subunit
MIDKFIWYEKYRPKSIDEMVLPEKTREMFESFIEDREIPHLFLYGPKGTGKTTISRILIDKCSGAKLILNASSNDRGIETVKTKVKNFARSKKANEELNICFMDEADGLTVDAQFALKNTIEAYHNNCRFIFTANHPHKVIEEIHSRCVVVHFDELNVKDIYRICRKIMKTEDIEFTRRDIVEVISEYAPDIRSIINRLQAGSISGVFRIKDAQSLSYEKVKPVRTEDVHGYRDAFRHKKQME